MILTDEEIESLFHGYWDYQENAIDVARSIEKAVIEKLAPIQLKQDERWRRLKDGQFIAEWKTCPYCDGKGDWMHKANRIGYCSTTSCPCQRCNGTGRIAVPVEVSE